MTDKELQELLARTSTPSRPAEFWTRFEEHVLDELRCQKSVPAQSIANFEHPRHALRWAMGALAAAGCIVLMVFQLGRPGPKGEVAGRDLEVARAYYQQMQEVFPGQIKAIVLEAKGPRIVLSEKPNVAANAPVYLRICARTGCKSVVTFSGQEILVGDQRCEVLVDGRGEIIVTGPQFFWSTRGERQGPCPAHIRAQIIHSA